MNHLLPLAVFAATLVAADNSGPDKSTTGKLVVEDDKERIQGTWKCTAKEADGKEIKDTIAEAVTFKGDAVTSSTSPDDKATFSLDAGKRPGMLEIVVKGPNGQLKENVRVLYELKVDISGVHIDAVARGGAKGVQFKKRPDDPDIYARGEASREIKGPEPAKLCATTESDQIAHPVAARAPG